MTTELIIAPPATGKTAACIQRIQEVQKEHPLAQVWVLVPDRQKGAYFRTRLASAGGGMGVTTGTFGDLYRDLLERNGIFVPVASQALGHRLIQETVSAVHASGELTHYAAIRDKPGFLLALQDAFAELRGAVVRPERFLEYTQHSSRSRHELAILYDHFLTRLQQMNWVDMEGQSWSAIEALETHPQAGSYIRLVVVDGFTSFTGARLQFLHYLSKQAGEMLITLPGEHNSTRQVNRKSQREIIKIERLLSPQVTTTDLRPHLPRAVLHLEQHILDPGDFQKIESSQPLMMEVRSQTEEAREVLRWIKAFNIRKGIALSECAIFVSNLKSYQPLLRAAANEFGVQVHFSHPAPLLDSPAVKSLLMLLNLPGEDYNTRSLLNILHSPYLDFGLDASMIEDLEKVSQQAIIVMGRAQWNQAWKMLEKFSLTDDDYMDEDRHQENLVKGIDLTALQSSFGKFWRLFEEIEITQSQQGWVAWLEQRLEELEFVDRLSSEWDWEAYQSLGGALKALAMSESVVGVREITYVQFLNDLVGTLSGACIEEPRESRLNSVLVGGMIEARTSRYKAAALLGLSEGLFPVVENPDPFLDEDLRRDLGMEPRLGREQSSIFYQAITRTDDHLLLTRPYLTGDGEIWHASPYWLSAKTLFMEKSLQKIQAATPRSQSDAASPQELLFWAVQQNKLHFQKDGLSASWQHLDKSQKILMSRRSRQAHGPHEGNVEQIADSLAIQFAP